jgi:GTP:adenosylcobinamide-phosphate guanylyltransferase
VFTLFVSSTTAWYLNPIVEEKTREVVSIIETPFVVLQSDYVYLGDDKIVLTLENSATTTQSTNVEVQALDSSGEIILGDDAVELV